MTSTKENLKSFIERWEEHPNSPYIFDANTSLILPTADHEKNTSSGFSSRGCSPSPCQSLSSNTELFENGMTPENEIPNEIENDFEDALIRKETDPKSPVKPQKELFERPSSSASVDRQTKSKQEYLQSFDRRHSDSNYVMNHTSSLERINLAEEIKKLSDRLLVLSSINDELQEFNKRMDENKKSKTTSNDSSKTQTKRTEMMKNIKNASFSSTTKTEKNTSHMVHSKSLMSDTEKSKESKITTTTSVVNDLTERLKSLDEIPSVFKKVVNVTKHTETAHETISNSFGSFLKSTTNSANTSGSTSPCNLGSVPWTITNRRTKFRVTQLSRDVPVGSPDSHQTIFLEEAANTTKDCLLQLLDKYNGKETRTCTIRRHQSIAVGHGMTDNLGYNSMNSINAFFKRNVFQQNGTIVRKIKARIESKH